MALYSDSELKAQIVGARTIYNMNMRHYNANLKFLESNWFDPNIHNTIEDATVHLEAIIAFCCNEQNAMVFAYQKGLKEKVMDWLKELTEADGTEIYDYMSSSFCNSLRRKASNAYMVVKKIIYVRHIDVR
jgi:hypothetical protein